MRIFVTICMMFLAVALFAQQPVRKGNYALAARFSPDKVNKMLFSTSVDPHWLKLTDRFWYVYETREGKTWYIVDALKGSKRAMFDHTKLAAEITKIVKDPFDAQHLPIEILRHHVQVEEVEPAREHLQLQRKRYFILNTTSTLRY
jgi:dipeptidyl-peptidase 4